LRAIAEVIGALIEQRLSGADRMARGLLLLSKRDARAPANDMTSPQINKPGRVARPRTSAAFAS
jgi:hypothetical protein